MIRDLEQRLQGFENPGDVGIISCIQDERDFHSNNIDDGLGVYELCDADEAQDEPEAEFSRILQQFDERTQAAAEPTEELNLGTLEDPKIVHISATLSPEEKEARFGIERNKLFY